MRAATAFGYAFASASALPPIATEKILKTFSEATRRLVEKQPLVECDKCAAVVDPFNRLQLFLKQMPKTICLNGQNNVFEK